MISRHPEAKDPESQLPRITWLVNFSPEKLGEYGAPYQLTASEVDHLIQQSRKRYYAYCAVAVAASASWIACMPFQVEESTNGILSIGQVAAIAISARASVIAGVFIGVLGGATLVIMMPIKEWAIKHVLHSFRGPSWHEWFQASRQHLREKPLEFTIDRIVDVSVCISNISGAMLAPVGLSILFDIQSPAVKALLAALLVPPQYIFYEYFFDVHKGLRYMRDKTVPSLYSLFKEADIATFFHIVLQGWICAAGTRAFPFYYRAGLDCEEYVGFWAPVYMVVAGNFMQSVLTLTKTISERFLKSRMELETLIAVENEETITALIQSELARRKGDPEKLKQHILRGMREAALIDFAETQPNFYIQKADPAIVLFLAVRSVLGAYLGELIAEEFTSNPLITGCAAAALGLSFAVLSWKGDARRVNHDLVLADRKKAAVAASPRQKISLCETLTVDVLGTLLVWASGALTADGTLGTLASPIKAITTLALMLTFERGLATIIYNSSLKDTMRGWFATPQHNQHRLFHRVRGGHPPQPTFDVQEADESRFAFKINT